MTHADVQKGRERARPAPHRSPWRSTTGFLKNVLRAAAVAFRRFRLNDDLTSAGNLAYIGLFSLFPFLILVVAVTSLVGETSWGAQFASQILHQLPPTVAQTLSGPFEHATHGYGRALTFGLVGTVWLAASGLEATRSVLNRAYRVPHPPPLWRRRLQSVGLILTAAGATMVWMAFLVVGPTLWATIEPYLAPNPVANQIWVAARYLVSASVLFGAVATFYYVLPARRLEWRWIVPGAVLAVTAWLITATLYSTYLSVFGAFTGMYGSLSGVIVVLLFFYISGVIFIFGAEFNAALSEIHEREVRDGQRAKSAAAR